MKRKSVTTLIITIITGMIFSIVSGSADGHSPSDMDLEYNNDLMQLKVMITHTVEDPSLHYIDKITVFKNGSHYTNNTYNSQPENSDLIYSFQLNLDGGEKIRVVATCNQGGFMEDEIVIEPEGTDGEGDDTPFITTGMAVVFITLLSFIFSNKRKR